MLELKNDTLLKSKICSFCEHLYFLPVVATVIITQTLIYADYHGYFFFCYHITTQAQRGKGTEVHSCLAYLPLNFLIKLLSIRSIFRLNSETYRIRLLSNNTGS